MRYYIGILLVVGLFGCRENLERHPDSLRNISIDSMVVYYTTDTINYAVINDSTSDSTIKLENFLHYYGLDINSNYYDVRLKNSVIISDSLLINNFRFIFYDKKNDEKVLSMLNQKCLPDYKDLIIFYSKGRRIGGIKISFGCRYILFLPSCLNDDFDITINSFEDLRDYFNKNIHKVN